jgi:tetratricopeptide (TPR) repeat protein
LFGDDYSTYAAAAFRQQGRVRTDRGHLRLALSSLSKAKGIFMHLGDHSGISIIDGDLAGVFDRLGDAQKSLAHVAAAEGIVRELGDDTQRAWVLNRRGLVLWHHGQAEAAVACFEEAETINQALGATGLIGGNRTNQGLALADLDEFERALAQFQSAERIHRESGNQAWAAVNYGGWGRALVMRGQPGDLEQGLELILRAEALSRKVYYPENISLHAGDRGRGLFLLRRIAEARKALREAVAIEHAIGASKDLRHFSNLVLLSRIEEALGNDEECREAALRARSLEKRLSISKSHRLRKVREDIACLEDIEIRMGDREIAEKKISRLLVECNSAPLLSAELEQINDAILRVSDEYSYEYPWAGLEKELRGQQRTTIKLFGYGSLLNRESALRTFPGPNERFTPAIAFGVVRLFNFEMPDAVRARYKALENSLERGLLNAEVTSFMSDVANGALVDVELEEIESLRVREVGYDLRPVICVTWDQEISRTPFVAYILSCPNRLWKGRPLTNPDLRPHRGYFAQCCEGAASISKSFLDFWLYTTFMGDGETRVTREE